MPAQKSRTALSHMMRPLSDDELEPSGFDQTMDSSAENVDPVAQPRAKPATRGKTVAKPASNKVSKPRVSPRRAGGAAATSRAKTSNRRKALQERCAPNESETEEVDEFDGDAPGKTQNRGVEYGHDGYPKTKERERATKSKPAAASTRTKMSSRAPSKEPFAYYIPETQPEDMDVEQSIEEVTEVPLHTAPRPARRAESRVRYGSNQRQTSVPRSRAGSVSDPERRAHDPALRRRLGDLTKKLESLDLKYKQLKEVSTRDAETNFDKLRKSSEQRAKDQDDVIASLKKDLAAARASQAESKSLKTRIASLETENQRLVSESASLSSESRNSQALLTAAQNEVKTLTVKLSAAAKQASSAVAPSQKNAANAASLDTTNLKLKEELYSDLTGLMVRNVKKVEGEDVFDCIQTGRNGTLHFHLSIPPLPTNADGTACFEDAEFAYTPLLDEKNDRELIDVLPDYLTEEICFPRGSAAKFYAKVLDCMTKKVVIEE